MIPLWSGLLLRTKHVNGDVLAVARDTNSYAENWFKYVKHDIEAKSRARPANFVIDLKVAVESRMRLCDFPGAEKKENQKTNHEAIRSISKRIRGGMEKQRKSKRFPQNS